MCASGDLLFAGGLNPPLESSASGVIIPLAGVPQSPVEGAFVFTSVGKAKEFVLQDEYVKNGCVVDWKISEWGVAVKRD